MPDRVAQSNKSVLDPEPKHEDAGACQGYAFSKSYPALVESVGAIRRTVAHFATKAGVPPTTTEAVKLAVSEAATNVAVHAYADTDQPALIEVEATYQAGELRVSIADTGPGLQPGGGRPGLGLGLAVMEELADQLELLQGGRHGLRVVMRFAVPAPTRDGGRG